MKCKRWDVEDLWTENEGSTLPWRIEKAILCTREQNFGRHSLDAKVITLCYDEQEGGWSLYHNIIIITESWIIGGAAKLKYRFEKDERQQGKRKRWEAAGIAAAFTTVAVRTWDSILEHARVLAYEGLRKVMIIVHARTKGNIYWRRREMRGMEQEC